MRDYELIVIVRPNQDETQFNALNEKIKSWIKDAGGTTNDVEIWGKRPMAYEIKKEREGLYVLFNISMPPTFSKELERNLGFQEAVLRFLLTLK
jgi:small subunit ribosomal protein S6